MTPEIKFTFWFSERHSRYIRAKTLRVHTVKIDGRWQEYTSVSLPDQHQPFGYSPMYADYRKLGTASLTDTRVA